MIITKNLTSDFRFALRQWRHSPGFTAVSILSLALGIGATSTVFSVVYGALIDPLPYRGADRMVRLRLHDQTGARGFLLLSSRQFTEFKKLDVLDGAVAMDRWDMAATGDALPEAVRTAHLSADAFRYFGVPVPYTLLMGDSMNLVIRTESAPLSMVEAIRKQIHSIDPGQPVTQIQTAEDLLRAMGWAREQFVATLFLVFAALALALAAAGLYSVISYATARRSQEFGIRTALGAQRRHVMGLVLTSAATTVTAGVAAGLVLSAVSHRLLARWTAGSVYDPVVLGSAVGLLIVVSGLASWAPAWRAASGDPVRALRDT